MEINCPLLVNDYNKFMGRVDKNDQLAIVHKEMKQLVWYNHVFLMRLTMTVHNCYVIE